MPLIFLRTGLLFSFLFSGLSLFSQKKNLPDFLVWEKGDTTFCNITSIEREAGKIHSIDFTSSDQQKIELRNSFEISKIRFISINNEFFWEAVPFKAKKNSAKRLLEIEENGRVKIYGNLQLVVRTNSSGVKVIANPTAKAGGINRIIKLENGRFYDLDKRSIKNEIAPHFNNCSAFREGFGEKITPRNIMAASGYYNKVCK